MIKLKHTKTTLASGLRVVTVPMKNTSAVTCVVMVKTGSRYERLAENGIAHVLEHLFFQGTTKRPDNVSVKRELDRVGAESNAFTSHDHTGYYVKADVKHLDLALDILSDMYLNALFKPEDIEKERRVVVEEINMRADSPRQRVWKNFYALLYPKNPLGWEIAGPIKTVLSLKRGNFLAFRNKFYVGENTVVIIAGNIDASAARKVRTYFGAVRSGRSSRFLPFRDVQKKPLVSLEFKKSDQAYIVLGMKAYSLYDRKRYALDVLSAILGGYSSSRLTISVRDELGLAYFVGSDASYHEDTGYFSAYAGLNLKNTELGLQVILRELERVKTELIPEHEIADAKSHIEGAMSLGLESSDAVAMSLGTAEIMRGKIQTPEEYIAQMKRVTARDLQQVARELFCSAKLNFAVVGPFKDPKVFEKLLKL